MATDVCQHLHAFVPTTIKFEKLFCHLKMFLLDPKIYIMEHWTRCVLRYMSNSFSSICCFSIMSCKTFSHSCWFWRIRSVSSGLYSTLIHMLSPIYTFVSSFNTRTTLQHVPSSRRTMSAMMPLLAICRRRQTELISYIRN